MEDYRLTLRRLALRDDRFIDSLLAEERGRPVASGLDCRTHAIARIAALITLDAAPPSYMSAVSDGLDAGLTMEEIVGVLMSVMPVVGAARIVSAAPKLGLALGYDVSEAFEEVGSTDRRS